MKKIVGIEASHDSATRAASRYRAKRVYAHFVKRGFGVTRLAGKRAARTRVVVAVADADVVYVTGVGHGTYDQFRGYGDLPVFQIGGYGTAEVRRKIVHFLSCLTARGLGPDFVTHGTLAFFGYSDNFSFDAQSQTACLDCDAEIDRSFADGLTAGEVYKRAFVAFTAQITLARESGKAYKAATLENNRDNLCAPPVHRRFGRRGVRIGTTGSPKR